MDSRIPERALLAYLRPGHGGPEGQRCDDGLKLGHDHGQAAACQRLISNQQKTLMPQGRQSEKKWEHMMLVLQVVVVLRVRTASG